MPNDEKNYAAESGATRAKGGPFDYSAAADEEVRREKALKSHDEGCQDEVYPRD